MGASTVRRLIIIHETSEKKYSRTDENFLIRCTRVSGGIFEYLLLNLPYNEREKGRTDLYDIDLAGEKVYSNKEVRYKIGGEESPEQMSQRKVNGWLPSKIIVLGVREADGAVVLLSAHISWPKSKWWEWGIEANPDHMYEYKIA